MPENKQKVLEFEYRGRKYKVYLMRDKKLHTYFIYIIKGDKEEFVEQMCSNSIIPPLVTDLRDKCFDMIRDRCEKCGKGVADFHCINCNKWCCGECFAGDKCKDCN